MPQTGPSFGAPKDASRPDHWEAWSWRFGCFTHQWDSRYRVTSCNIFWLARSKFCDYRERTLPLREEWRRKVEIFKRVLCLILSECLVSAALTVISGQVYISICNTKYWNIWYRWSLWIYLKSENMSYIQWESDTPSKADGVVIGVVMRIARVEIVMLEKLDCVLSNRATRPYIHGHTSANAYILIYV